MDGQELIPAPRPSGLVRPVATPADVVEAHKEAVALIQKALEEGRDYGMIPGVKKPSLLKPGAERLALAFGCAPQYEVAEREIDHDRRVEWAKGENSGTSRGLYRYVVKCRLMRPDGRNVGEGLGSCSTMESKYISRPRDSENTVLKMAEKRALVAAVLGAFGLSDRFTQDVEDGHGGKKKGAFAKGGPRGRDAGDDEGAPMDEEPPPAPEPRASKAQSDRFVAALKRSGRSRDEGIALLLATCNTDKMSRALPGALEAAIAKAEEWCTEAAAKLADAQAVPAEDTI